MRIGAVTVVATLAIGAVSGCGGNDAAKSRVVGPDITGAIGETLFKEVESSGGFSCPDVEEATVEEVKSGNASTFTCELELFRIDPGGRSTRTSTWDFDLKSDVDLTGPAAQVGFGVAPDELDGCANLP